MEELILVDETDAEIGFAEKVAAHENGGQLHRAFSIFVFNAEGQMLLQRRADGKYHFGGRWTNTCCSHPRRGEDLQDAAHKRLQFEMGFDTELRKVGSFIYRAEDPDSGLVEHELDHVFVGQFDGIPQPNPQEVGDWKWMEVAELCRDLENNPQRYSPWFRPAFEQLGTSI